MNRRGPEPGGGYGEAPHGAGPSRNTLGRGLIANDEPIHKHTTVTLTDIERKRKTTEDAFKSNPKYAKMAQNLKARTEELMSMVILDVQHGRAYLDKASAETNLKNFVQLYLNECLPDVDADYTGILSSTPPAALDLSKMNAAARAFWRSATEFLVVERAGRFQNAEHNQSLRNRTSADHSLIRLFAAYRRMTGLKVDALVESECFTLAHRLCSDFVRVKPTSTWDDVKRIVFDTCFEPAENGHDLRFGLWRSGMERLLFVALMLLMVLTGARPGEILRGQYQADCLKFKDLVWCWTLTADRTQVVLVVDVTFRLLKTMRTNDNAFRTQPLYSTGSHPLCLDIARILTTLAKRARVFAEGYDFDVAKNNAFQLLCANDEKSVEIPKLKESDELPVFPFISRKGSREPTLNTKPMAYDQAAEIQRKLNKHAGIDYATLYSYRRNTVDALNSCKTVREADMQTSVGHRPGTDTTIRNYISRRNTVDMQSVVMEGHDTEMIRAEGLRFVQHVQLTADEKHKLNIDHPRIRAELDSLDGLHAQADEADAAVQAAETALQEAGVGNESAEAQQQLHLARNRAKDLKKQVKRAIYRVHAAKKYFYAEKSRELTEQAHQAMLTAVGTTNSVDDPDASETVTAQETLPAVDDTLDMFRDDLFLMDDVEVDLDSIEANQQPNLHHYDVHYDGSGLDDLGEFVDYDFEDGDLSPDLALGAFDVDTDALLHLGAQHEEAFFAQGGNEAMLAEVLTDSLAFRQMMLEGFNAGMHSPQADPSSSSKSPRSTSLPERTEMALALERALTSLKASADAISVDVAEFDKELFVGPSSNITLEASFASLTTNAGTQQALRDAVAVGSCGTCHKTYANIVSGAGGRSVEARIIYHLNHCDKDQHGLAAYLEACLSVIDGHPCPWSRCVDQGTVLSSEDAKHVKAHTASGLRKRKCVLVMPNGMNCDWVSQWPVTDASELHHAAPDLARHEEFAHGLPDLTRYCAKYCEVHQTWLYGHEQIQRHFEQLLAEALADDGRSGKVWLENLCCFCLHNETLLPTQRVYFFASRTARNRHVLQQHIFVVAELQDMPVEQDCPLCQQSLHTADLPEHLLAVHGYSLANSMFTTSIARNFDLLAAAPEYGENIEDVSALKVFKEWVESGKRGNEARLALQSKEAPSTQAREPRNKGKQRARQQQDPASAACAAVPVPAPSAITSVPVPDSVSSVSESTPSSAGPAQAQGPAGRNKGNQRATQPQESTSSAPAPAPALAVPAPTTRVASSVASNVASNVSAPRIRQTASGSASRLRTAVSYLCPLCDTDGGRHFSRASLLAVHIASEHVLYEREAFVLCFCGTEFTAGEFPRHLEVHDIWLTGSRNHGLTDDLKNLYCSGPHEEAKKVWLQWVAEGRTSTGFEPPAPGAPEPPASNKRKARKTSLCPFCADDAKPKDDPCNREWLPDKLMRHMTSQHIFADRQALRTCPECNEEQISAGQMPLHLETHGYRLSAKKRETLRDDPLDVFESHKENRTAWQAWVRAGCPEDGHKVPRKPYMLPSRASSSSAK